MSRNTARLLKPDYLTEERIAFQHASPGFLIGEEFFSGLSGFWYIRQLLIHAGLPISCSQLRGGSGSSEDSIDYAAANDLNILDERSYEPLMTPSKLKLLAGMAQELESTLPHISDPFEHEQKFSDLKRLQRLLARDAITDKKGNYVRPRAFSSQADKDRKAVSKSINTAICRLIENPATPEIGLHLKDNIVTGGRCEYVGKQKWKF